MPSRRAWETWKSEAVPVLLYELGCLCVTIQNLGSRAVYPRAAAKFVLLTPREWEI